MALHVALPMQMVGKVLVCISENLFARVDSSANSDRKFAVQLGLSE
jgi:hypothetical protein